MDAEIAQKLRAPFPPEAIGKLPKAGTTLDYVGHAAVTDRLLQADPEWTWEPVATADDGGPLVRVTGNDAELWIRLTIGGVTRLGVGTAPAKSFELSKQLVSDAIRNGAMRFGVAIDLWAKEDLHAVNTPPPPPPEVISGVDAERFAAALNAVGPDARKDWLAWFDGTPPAKLPLARLAEAEGFVKKLEAGE